jgi:hypothetical protein
MRDPSGLDLLKSHDFPKPLLHNVWSLNIMPPIDGCPSWKLQGFTFSRRKLFQKITAGAVPFVFPPKPSAVTPLKDRPSPDFWFGDHVIYCWVDEDTKESHSETGEIVGAVWDSREDSWEYAVNWLSSTTYPADSYPIYDGSFLTAGEMCKL